jgi:hypothetical protein
MLVSIVLSNGSSGSLNVVDDTAGNPFLTLTTNYYDGRLVSGPAANTLKLNLAPGASLTNNVWITNPPPRFQLRTLVRDFDAERRAMYVRLARSLAVKAKLLRERLGLGHPQVAALRERLEDHRGVMPTSPWIQPGEYQQ